MNKFTIVLSYIVFYLIQLTWGLLHNLIGVGLAIWMLVTGHKPHRCGPYIYFVEPKLAGSVDGGIIYVTCTENAHTNLHEMGHGLQNMCWGPLMVFVIVIPSFTRFWYREWYWKYKYPQTGKALPAYDSIWFEGQATKWGTKMWATYWSNRKK
jgi:hypothetical protein